MDNTEDVELHELETIERNLNGDSATESDATAAYAVFSPSGFMVFSPSGFMIF